MSTLLLAKKYIKLEQFQKGVVMKQSAFTSLINF